MRILIGDLLARFDTLERALTALAIGVPPPTAAVVHGHASPNTTAVYTTATAPKPASSSHTCGAQLP